MDEKEIMVWAVRIGSAGVFFALIFGALLSFRASFNKKVYNSKTGTYRILVEVATKANKSDSFLGENEGKFVRNPKNGKSYSLEGARFLQTTYPERPHPFAGLGAPVSKVIMQEGTIRTALLVDNEIVTETRIIEGKEIQVPKMIDGFPIFTIDNATPETNDDDIVGNELDNRTLRSWNEFKSGLDEQVKGKLSPVIVYIMMFLSLAAAGASAYIAYMCYQLLTIIRAGMGI